MKRILIHSYGIESAEVVRKKIESKMANVSVSTSTDLQKTEQNLVNQPCNLLVLDLESFTKRYSQFIRDIRVWGVNCSILVISNNVNPIQFARYDMDGRPYFLPNDYEAKKLVGVAKKLLKLKQIPQQMHPRFHTNEDASIEFLNSNQTISSSMYNLSKGGAYMEFDGGFEGRMGVGEVIRLNVRLGREAQHQLNAKVIWTTNKGRYSGRKGLGVKFLKTGDIYSQLLETS